MPWRRWQGTAGDVGNTGAVAEVVGMRGACRFPGGPALRSAPFPLAGGATQDRRKGAARVNTRWTRIAGGRRWPRRAVCRGSLVGSDRSGTAESDPRFSREADRTGAGGNAGGGCDERGGPLAPSGDRHGRRMLRLILSFGTMAIAVPCMRRHGEDRTGRPWRIAVLSRPWLLPPRPRG